MRRTVFQPCPNQRLLRKTKKESSLIVLNFKVPFRGHQGENAGAKPLLKFAPVSPGSKSVFQGLQSLLVLIVCCNSTLSRWFQTRVGLGHQICQCLRVRAIENVIILSIYDLSLMRLVVFRLCSDTFRLQAFAVILLLLTVDHQGR